MKPVAPVTSTFMRISRMAVERIVAQETPRQHRIWRFDEPRPRRLPGSMSSTWAPIRGDLETDRRMRIGADSKECGWFRVGCKGGEESWLRYCTFDTGVCGTAGLRVCYDLHFLLFRFF